LVLISLTQLHIFPHCKKLAKQVGADSDKLYFTTLDPSLDGPLLQGHSPNAELDTHVLWSKHFGTHQVVTVTPAIYESISAFGKVKGDKSTLYKYLNPHLLAVTSVGGGGGRVSVVDSVSGRSIYEVEIASVNAEKGIVATMIQNWLVYRWLDTQGWRIASVELYEDRSVGRSET
jgi:hypothetical protein